MSEPLTVRELLDMGARVLEDSTHIFEDHDSREGAEELLAFCLDVEPRDLDDDDVPPRRAGERYLACVTRRAAGEPLPHITGHIEFYGLDFVVRPGPFVPRPSSELTVERAAGAGRRRPPHDPIVVDVCTGCGPIALAIADEIPHAEVWGTDIDAEGLAVGRANARRLGIGNVHLRRGDMYGALPARLRGRVDVITGHVPYVPPDEVDDLPTEVVGYEPAHTLTDHSGDGLDLMRIAVGGAADWLKPGGWLLLEMSDDVAPKVRRMMRQAGLDFRGIATDADELSVVVEARMPASGQGARGRAAGGGARGRGR